MKKLIASMMAAALSVALLPASAFAQGTDLAAGDVAGENIATQSITLTTQAKVRKHATKVMREKYKAALENARSGRGVFHKVYKTSPSGWYVYYYTLYDVDKNGVPELFVNAGTCSADTTWYGFTIKSGKLKSIGKFGDGNSVLYKGKGKAVYALSAHMGVMRAYIGKMKGGKIKSKVVAVDKSELKGFPKIKKYTKSHKLKLLKNSSGSYDYSLINKAKVS